MPTRSYSPGLNSSSRKAGPSRKRGVWPPCFHPPAAHIEVYDFSAVPKPDAKVIVDRVSPRKNTTDVKVAKAVPVQQHGLAGTAAEGTAKIRGTPVQFRIVSLPMGKRAVLVAAFVDQNAVKKFDKNIQAILDSVRAAKP